jgi:hypothetical protein
MRLIETALKMLRDRESAGSRTARAKRAASRLSTNLPLELRFSVWGGGGLEPPAYGV